MTYAEREALTTYVLECYSQFITLQDHWKLRPGYTDDYSRAVFARELAEKILTEHKDDVFLNYCPVCGRLARTPQALQCPSGHRWAASGTPGTSG